jgi:hypothetical protein
MYNSFKSFVIFFCILFLSLSVNAGIKKPSPSIQKSPPKITQEKKIIQTKQKSPLAIQDIVLKNNTIHVTIVTTKTLLPADYTGVILHVTAPKQKTAKKWTLQKVDPKRSLSRSKKPIIFNTKISLSAPGIVKAALLKGTWKSSKTKSLIPTKTMVAKQKIKKKTGLSPSNLTMSDKARIPKAGKKQKIVPKSLDTSSSRTKAPLDTSINAEMSLETISVTSPKYSDKIPPDRGINFKVIYSINYGPAPANVTIRLARESGGYGIELYSGPPLGVHSILRPAETNTWPTYPDKYYRIIVSCDDGRTGQSQKFSLSPYVFYLVRPNGGETKWTSVSPWQFDWYAENSIKRIECTLLKGGVEMFSWTPHVSPPQFLYGDEITISPEQPWHPEGEDYKLRIRGYIDGADDVGPPSLLVGEDESEANFRIVENWSAPATPDSCAAHYPITIRFPAERAFWEKTRSYYIAWCVFDETVRTVNLSLINTSTGERWLVDTGVSGNSIMWPVPEYLEPGNYHLHIESTDGRYAMTTTYSIYIQNWVSDPSSPEYTEVWRIGETQTIEWESAGLSDQTVDIVLRRPHSSRTLQIADDIPNTGSFDWPISAGTLPEGDTMWENAYLTIVIGGMRSQSEYFTIRR